MGAVIETSGLTKHYGRVRALDGLDLSVQRGEVHGFLGPNGAGKSTTIRILLGLARTRSGHARVFSRDPWKNATALHRRIAYVPGDVSLWPNLSGGEAIDLLCRLRGEKTGDEYRKRRARLLETFQLDPTTKARNYSKGNRQKVALVAAFAKPAELYIFDEPTAGLDPLMETVFNREVARVSQEGATVFLSSHILSEVEQLCDRVTIIRAGKAAESGSLSDLRRLTRIHISFASAPGLLDVVRSRIPHADDAVSDRGKIRFTLDNRTVTDALPTLADMGVAGLTITPPSLEDLFLQHYESNTPEADENPDPVLNHGSTRAGGADPLPPQNNESTERNV